MPSGKNHDRITLLCLPWLTVIAFLATRKSQLTFLVTGSFLFSALMFGPDLDIYSIQYKRWGILRSLWLPYRQFISHRSVLSHGLIIGTVIRIVYLSSFILVTAILIIAISQLIIGFYWNWREFAVFCFSLVKFHPQESLALFLGLELGAMSHSVADLVTSYLSHRDAETQRKPPHKNKLNKKSKIKKVTKKAKNL